jgi:hypothetical protein
VASWTISPRDTTRGGRRAARHPPDERPVATNRPPWFTRLTLGAIESERDRRVQRRASQRRRRRIEDRQVTSVRCPRLAAACAPEVPAASVTRIEQERSSDDGGTVDPAVRSLPADPSVASDIDRERFAIRKLLTKMTGEEHRLERLGHTFEADEQDTKDRIESTWRREHWGQAPTRPPSWRNDTKSAVGAQLRGE